MNFSNLKQEHPQIYQLIKDERKRQERTINLIPSENYAPKSVLEAAGSSFTNKYSEGYPGARYYPGNSVVDKLENMTKEKAKAVFSLGQDWQVNVQPYSGSPANTAVYLGLLDFDDKIMGLSLSHGGHLTHGHDVSFSGQAYKAIHYELSEDTGRLDYKKIEKKAKKENPDLIVCGATAYPRKIDFEKFGQIADEVGAYLLADISHIAGLIAAGLHPSPFEHADIVTTTTHKTLRGPRSAIIFSKKELAEDIDKAVFPGLQGGPHNHITAAKAVGFLEALRPEFRDYQKDIVANAKKLAEELKKRGFELISGGTDNHLILMNLKDKIDATKAEKRLERANILANRNTIPGDKSPYKPSGLRLGTPAVTTRGFGEDEMRQIAEWIAQILEEKHDPEDLKSNVVELCENYPIYEG
jgi:glycine hydroxymethyltransferase